MTWIRAKETAAITPDAPGLLRHGKKQIALFRVGDSFYAIDNRCPHEGYPLVQGTVDDASCVLTCQWHNWKFRLDTGENTLGEDHVRAYRTKQEGGHLWVDVTEPTRQELETEVMRGFEAAVVDRQYGRIARELSRLLVSGIDPLVAVRHAVAMSYDKLEYGTTHAYAAAADWLALYQQMDADDTRIVCLTEAVDHISDDMLRHATYPFTERTERFSGSAFLDAVESEKEELAIAHMRGALDAGRTWGELEPWLAHAALAHYNDYGHAVIYVVKSRQLLSKLGAELTERILLALTRMLCYTTRDDLLPDFRAYVNHIERAPSRLGEVYEPLNGVELSGKTTNQMMDWVASHMSESSPRSLYDALVEASAMNLLRFDEKHAVAAKPSVSLNVSFLGFTHAITFANAGRRLAESYPELWPKVLLQMACFVGRVKRFLRKDLEVTPWQVADAEGFMAACRDTILDHGLSEPIFSAHLIKTWTAVGDELPQLPDRTARLVLAALNRYFHAETKEKHPLRAARQALALVNS